MSACQVLQLQRACALQPTAPHFDHAFHKRDNEFGMLHSHLLGAHDDGGNVGHLQGPVWIPG